MKVLKQRADAANAPASSVMQVVRHDYSHLPAAVVRQVCISQAQAAQTHESSSRTLNTCAKLVSTIRGTADASAISAELATTWRLYIYPLLFQNFPGTGLFIRYSREGV